MNIGLYSHHARRWLVFALLPAILISALGYFYTAHQSKTYLSQALLYVQETSFDITGVSTPTLDSQYLAQTYSQMIGDPVIMSTARHDVRRRFPRATMGQIQTVSSRDPTTQLDSQTFGVSDVNTNPRVAAFVAETVANVFVNRITSIGNQRYAQDLKGWNTQLKQAVGAIQSINGKLNKGGPPGYVANLRLKLAQQRQQISTLNNEIAGLAPQKDSAPSVSVFSPASVPTQPVGPHPKQTAALFGFVAFLLCAGGLLLYDHFDDSIKSPDEAEEVAGAPVLGTIQQFDAQKIGSQLITARQPRSTMSEAYRLIRTNIQFTNVDHPPRTIVVTSPLPKEGKSTTASNLARVFAEGGHSVTLVDADLRRPSIHRIFALDGRQGLTSMLVAADSDGHMPLPGDLPSLRLVPSGPVPPNPADLLGSERMRALLGHLSDENDIVIVDSPPALAVADAAVLSTMADGVILVIDPATSRKHDVTRARETIEGVGGKVLGMVVNRLTAHGSGYYYYYNYYHYGYHYGGEYGGDSSGEDRRGRPAAEPTASPASR